MKKIKIAPSILSSDFSREGEEIANITRDGADLIHLDVMDGNFVKNISFGPKFIKDCRKYSKAVFDAHLMILNPWKYIDKFADAGADIITVHQEACGDRLKETLKEIADMVKASGKDIDIEIDGGITKENVKLVKDAGANVIVAGSTIFNELDRAKIIRELREI